MKSLSVLVLSVYCVSSIEYYVIQILRLILDTHTRYTYSIRILDMQYLTPGDLNRQLKSCPYTNRARFPFGDFMLNLGEYYFLVHLSFQPGGC
jgi:hypothetical protein